MTIFKCGTTIQKWSKPKRVEKTGALLRAVIQSDLYGDIEQFFKNGYGLATHIEHYWYGNGDDCSESAIAGYYVVKVFRARITQIPGIKRLVPLYSNVYEINFPNTEKLSA